MNKIQIGKREIIHFIGIGGIGMSGLAQIMKTMGFNVQGSDVNENKNTDNCKNLGIKVFKGHSKKNISNATIIVKSTAIKKNNIKKISNYLKQINASQKFELKLLANYQYIGKLE